MNILWLSWKDANHENAGGAELVSTEIRKRLVKNGHNVRLLTAVSQGQTAKSIVDGVEIYRTGNRYSVYFKVKRLYKKNMAGWADIIIDEMNTIPFLGYSYDDCPTILLNYQLARIVWFYQAKFPISLVGYIIEPLYLRHMSKGKYLKILTESESTKQDLMRYGFKATDVSVFRVGLDISPLKSLTNKKSLQNVIYLGSVRPMKKTLDVVKAFELAREDNKNLSLDIVGDYSGAYGNKVFTYAKKSIHASAINFHGKVTVAVKKDLLQKADVIVITSVKEGWGLIATEAASQGVPAVAYAADGLRDSIIDNETGYLVDRGDYPKLASKIVAMLSDSSRYEQIRRNALENSKQFTYDNSYKDFVSSIGIS